MYNIKKLPMLLILSFLILLTFGSVNASDEISNINETLTSQSEINLVEAVSNNDVIDNTVDEKISDVDKISCNGQRSNEDNTLKASDDDKLQVQDNTTIEDVVVDRVVVYGKDFNVNVNGNVVTRDDAQLYGTV